jgi:hypothetical protein
MRRSRRQDRTAGGNLQNLPLQSDRNTSNLGTEPSGSDDVV